MGFQICMYAYPCGWVGIVALLSGAKSFDYVVVPRIHGHWG